MQQNARKKAGDGECLHKFGYIKEWFLASLAALMPDNNQDHDL